MGRTGPDAERIATAFVRGINGYIDWLATQPREMPLEFRLLGTNRQNGRLLMLSGYEATD